MEVIREVKTPKKLGGLQNDVLEFLSAFQYTLENSARKIITQTFSDTAM